MYSSRGRGSHISVAEPETSAGAVRGVPFVGLQRSCRSQEACSQRRHLPLRQSLSALLPQRLRGANLAEYLHEVGCAGSVAVSLTPIFDCSMLSTRALELLLHCKLCLFICAFTRYSTGGIQILFGLFLHPSNTRSRRFLRSLGHHLREHTPS